MRAGANHKRLRVRTPENLEHVDTVEKLLLREQQLLRRCQLNLQIVERQQLNETDDTLRAPSEREKSHGANARVCERLAQLLEVLPSGVVHPFGVEFRARLDAVAHRCEVLARVRGRFLIVGQLEVLECQVLQAHQTPEGSYRLAGDVALQRQILYESERFRPFLRYKI